MADSKTIGITGAAGYIGSNVAEAFLDRGYDVVALDNFHDPKVDSIGDEPIHEVDVRDRDVLRDTLADVDAVMHLAAITGVPQCDDEPETAFDVNVVGTENVAWLCRERGLPLVFPASMAVIGDPGELPITADHPRAPLNLYGRTKWMSEDDIHALAEDAFPALVLMKSNLYGHHETNGETVGKRTVMNIFVERARAGDPLSVHEPGTQSRDFIHVDDAARAYVDALQYLVDAPNGARTVPIASGENRSVLEIAQMVQRVIEEERGERVGIEMMENPRAAETVAEDFTVDTETARAVIGFDAQHSIEATIREMVRQ